MTRDQLLAQALAAGFTEAQFKALTAPQRIAFLHAAAVADQAVRAREVSAVQLETLRLYQRRLALGGTGPLPEAPP